MRDLPFFDANCALGAPMNGAAVFAAHAADLYAELDRNGVERAAVQYLNMESGAVFANGRIEAMLRDEDADRRLVGVWGVLPDACDELPGGDEFFRRMKAGRIGLLTLAPGPQRWIPARISIGRVMDAARERKIPFLVCPAAFQDGWGGLYRFLAEFPENRYIVVPGGLWGTDRQVRPLLEGYEGVHLETSTFWTPEGVRDIARKYGAHRVLYGSGYPAFNHGCMMAVVRNLDLPAADRRLIAAGNLERLLGEEEL